MADAADASAAHENPLIPNARLRQIYLAMMQARMLEKALPAARRVHAAAGYATGIAGMEACLVSAAVDLGPGDLVSDALCGGVVEYLRGMGLGWVLRAESKKVKRGAQGPLADCGGAAALPGAPGIAERLWAAMGAAEALKSAAALAKKGAKAGDEASVQRSVVVAYVRPGEATTAVWRTALEYAAVQLLPVVFVVMPGAGAAKVSGVSALARRCGVPGMAVDGHDAVAIYRVAQESIGRARMGGGAVLMECVPFVLHGGAAKPNSKPDAIAAIEQYMLQRGVVTRRWMEREARRFARSLAAARAAAAR
jgi:TPP-dependent pyruvate/acetoin dehydrogenase alpha subunit